MEVKAWLKNYFESRSKLPANFESVNFFEAGMIDSLGVIELVEALEKDFDVKFSEKYFQDRRFSSINGLAEIVSELKK